MTLDQLLSTNVFSRIPRGVQREYVPFNEALTAQAFADAINNGKMSVEDAWKHFWSYEEDAELFGFEGRNFMPAWVDIVHSLVGELSVDHARTLVHLMTDTYFQIEDSGALRQGSPDRKQYNPFEHSITYAMCFALTQPELAYELGDRLLQRPTSGFARFDCFSDDIWFPVGEGKDALKSRQVRRYIQYRRQDLWPETYARAALKRALSEHRYLPHNSIPVQKELSMLFFADGYPAEKVPVSHLHESIKNRSHNPYVKDPDLQEILASSIRQPHLTMYDYLDMTRGLST